MGWARSSIGLVLLANAAMKWWAQFYFVTNQKVMKVEGLLRKSTSGSALEKINDITMEEPLLGRWLGLRHGSGAHRGRRVQPALHLHAQAPGVPQGDPRREAPVGEAGLPGHRRRRPGARSTPAVAAAPAAPSGQEIADSIERLAQLRDSGAITTEEFEAKKAELLDRM